jgi:hypothetical protein
MIFCVKNQTVDIKFRYISEHRSKELTDDTLDEMSLNDTVRFFFDFSPHTCFLAYIFVFNSRPFRNFC